MTTEARLMGLSRLDEAHNVLHSTVGDFSTFTPAAPDALVTLVDSDLDMLQRFRAGAHQLARCGTGGWRSSVASTGRPDQGTISGLYIGPRHGLDQLAEVKLAA
jgi:hypothetical protein